MNPNAQFERDLEQWLQTEAPASAPAGFHATVMDRARTLRQRPGWATTLPVRRFGRGRGITLLAPQPCSVGGTLAAGSGLLRLPSVVPPVPAPSLPCSPRRRRSDDIADAERVPVTIADSVEPRPDVDEGRPSGQRRQRRPREGRLAGRSLRPPRRRRRHQHLVGRRDVDRPATRRPRSGVCRAGPAQGFRRDLGGRDRRMVEPAGG